MELIKYQSFNSKRRFGVEMEVNANLSERSLARVIQTCDMEVQITGWGYTIKNSTWVIKPDSTCGDTGRRENGGGFEAISPASIGLKHLLAIDRVSKKLKDCGAVVNNFCGLHCHVEIADFSDLQVATTAAIWCRLEKIISHMVPSHRIAAKSAKYCRLLTKKYTLLRKQPDPDYFLTTIKPKTLEPPGKRTAISFINYFRAKHPNWSQFRNRSTVELRLPESSLDFSDAKNWARFFVNFIESCVHKKFPNDISPVGVEEALLLMGLGDDLTIVSPGIMETKRWVLNRILRFSTSASLKKEVKTIISDL